ncbi:MAG: flavin reductase family protein [Bacillota bacterium]|jgi:flavin reductase (DIM6/NTAB) family NADH-FMN oxidoreductase RutF
MSGDVLFNKYSQELLQQLPKGAFLTVKKDDNINVMTIGWGSVGFIWGKPIFTLLVRSSRYTYELLDQTKEFSVSVPLNNDFKKELVLCGTKSGRDVDKFKEANLTPVPGKVISAPVIKECQLFYECKVVYEQLMDPKLLNETEKEKFYSQGDYHVIYYGEILASYVKE